METVLGISGIIIIIAGCGLLAFACRDSALCMVGVLALGILSAYTISDDLLNVNLDYGSAQISELTKANMPEAFTDETGLYYKSLLHQIKPCLESTDTFRSQDSNLDNPFDKAKVLIKMNDQDYRNRIADVILNQCLSDWMLSAPTQDELSKRSQLLKSLGWRIADRKTLIFNK